MSSMQPGLPLDARIYVAGHRGLAGSALLRRLAVHGFRNVITRTHDQLDLTNQPVVRDFFQREVPEYVFLAAAKVGGIMANNTYPAAFIRENLAIQTNVIHEAWCAGVKRLLFLGSSCIYPRECPQPIRESYLLDGPLEPTNRAYAVAKIAGVEMCWAYNRQYGTRYLAAMPTNLYGLGDNYDPQNSHVLPALIRKLNEGKITHARAVTLWGTGSPRREFLYSDDMADACLFLMNLIDERFESVLKSGPDVLAAPLINIGCGQDLTIRELAEVVRRLVGFEGHVEWDPSKPDGTPRKLLDTSRLAALGWKPRIGLEEGLVRAYKDFIDRYHKLRR